MPRPYQSKKQGRNSPKVKRERYKRRMKRRRERMTEEGFYDHHRKEVGYDEEA
jgi:hypothetical protein